jgi:hypothetical protein
MSNSSPDRNKAIVLEAFETLFNRRDYAGGRRLGTELQSARHTRTSRSRWSTMRFAAALLIALASFVAVPNAALAAEPQHHDQVPGFYRLKVGDLEVTTGQFLPILRDGEIPIGSHAFNSSPGAQWPRIFGLQTLYS